MAMPLLLLTLLQVPAQVPAAPGLIESPVTRVEYNAGRVVTMTAGDTLRPHIAADVVGRAHRMRVVLERASLGVASPSITTSPLPLVSRVTGPGQRFDPGAGEARCRTPASDGPRHDIETGVEGAPLAHGTPRL